MAYLLCFVVIFTLLIYFTSGRAIYRSSGVVEKMDVHLLADRAFKVNVQPLKENKYPPTVHFIGSKRAGGDNHQGGKNRAAAAARRRAVQSVCNCRRRDGAAQRVRSFGLSVDRH